MASARITVISRVTMDVEYEGVFTKESFQEKIDDDVDLWSGALIDNAEIGLSMVELDEADNDDEGEDTTGEPA